MKRILGANRNAAGRCALTVGLVALAVFAFSENSARADLFLLHSGGRVEGKLLNPDEAPRAGYLVQTAGGAKLMLARAQVAKVLTKPPELIEYEALLPKMPPDAEGNWKMAEWCRKQDGLDKEREKHLLAVIEFDPDHELARRGLGYSRIDGEWIKPDEHMEKFGYVRHGPGGWRLKQEVEIEAAKRAQELAEKGWRQKMKLWRGQLNGRRAAEALDEFKGIRDPVAAVALRDMLKEEDLRAYKLLYIEVLSNLEAGASNAALIETVMNDADEQVREAALQILAKRRPPLATTAFIGALKSKDNNQVLRAATGLAAVQDPAATLPLIDALNTKHKFIISTGGSRPGQIGATFSPTGGGGLNAGGGGPKIIERELQNGAVLEALVALSGGANFRYDEEAWRRWYTAQRVPVGLNLRRDE